MARSVTVRANRFEVLFDWRVGAVVRRIRIQRGVIDFCQGRRLDEHEAADLIRGRARRIRSILIAMIRRTNSEDGSQVIDLRPALTPSPG